MCWEFWCNIGWKHCRRTYYFWRVLEIWNHCAAAPPSQQQEQQSQSTSAGTIGLSNCVGRSEITTIALNDVGSSSFNHVIHPNHLNETVLHHHHHASAENADASANGENQSHFIYIHVDVFWSQLRIPIKPK